MASKNPFLALGHTATPPIVVSTIPFTESSDVRAVYNGNVVQGSVEGPGGGDGILASAGEVRIDGANTFNSVAGNVYHVTQHAAVQPMQPGPPQQLPHQPEHESETYARLLLPKRNGYPIWYPPPRNGLPPQYRQNGVAIGDVGIITAYGSFDFLFNICLPADHPINRNNVPDGFVPIEPALEEREIESIHDAWKAGSHVANGSIQVISHPLDPNNTGGERYTFQCQQFDGAILTLPKGGKREDLLDLIDFRNYAGKHGMSWYKYINQRRGRDATNGSVYLVTGYDKSRAWGTASFASITLPGTFNLSFTATTPAHRVRKYSHLWDQTGLASTKEGPLLELLEGADEPPENQCVFIRGFKIALGEGVWASLFGKVEVYPLTGQNPEEILQKSTYVPFGGTSSGLMGYFSFSGSSGSGGQDHGKHNSLAAPDEGSDVIITSLIPQPSPTLHPSTGLIKYMLSQSADITVAIVHDQVWTSVLKEDESTIPEPSVLIERIKDMYEPASEQVTASSTEQPEPELAASSNSDDGTYISGRELSTPLNEPSLDPSDDLGEEQSRNILPLCKAVEAGDKAIVASLLAGDSNVDVNARDDNGDGDTALTLAVKAGREDIVELLLKEPRIDANIKDADGRTPLISAAYENFPGIVRLLLDHARPGDQDHPVGHATGKADLNARDNDERTPFIVAASSGHDEIVEQLLEEDGIDFNLQCIEGGTALDHAIVGNHASVVSMLLTSGKVKINTRSKAGNSALAAAAFEGNEEILAMLLHQPGVDLESKNELGRTALMRAVAEGHEGAVKILLDPSSYPSAQDLRSVSTSSHQAEFPGSLPDINARDKQGCTALFLATELKHPSIASFLLKQPGIQPDLPNQYQVTPLMRAVVEADIFDAVLQDLISRDDVDIDLRDEDGRAALSHAVQYGGSQAVKLLVERGADVNTQTNQGWSPLSTAARFNQVEFIHMFLSGGQADPNSEDDVGDTPLHRAAYAGQKEAVEALLCYKTVDLRARNHAGLTPLHEAASNDKVDVVELLADHDPSLLEDVAVVQSTRVIVIEHAAIRGSIDSIKYLLPRYSREIDFWNQRASNMLANAIKRGHMPVVEILLEQGHDFNLINLTNSSGRRPVAVAVIEGNVPILQRLLEVPGVDINLPDIQGMVPLTPLMTAVDAEGSEIVDVLLAHPGTDPNKQDWKGRTPLAVAAQKGCVSIVTSLLSKGAKPNLRDTNGRMAIHYAVTKGSKEVVEVLLKHPEVDARMKDRSGKRLVDTLISAAKRGVHQEVVDLLLTYK